MQTQNSSNNQSKVRVNFHIRATYVKVIDSNGDFLGEMTTKEAIKLAQDQNLDLIEISPNAIPPIVKIDDLGRFKYSEKKKQSEAKKNQKSQETKELTLRPVTEQHDLDVKVNQAKEFLKNNCKVKFTVRFKGREIALPHIGREKLECILKNLEGLITANPTISVEGKFMSVVVFPIKK